MLTQKVPILQVKLKFITCFFFYEWNLQASFIYLQHHFSLAKGWVLVSNNMSYVFQSILVVYSFIGYFIGG